MKPGRRRRSGRSIRRAAHALRAPRQWANKQHDGLRAGVVIVVTTALLCIGSHIIWQAMAGERLRLSQQSNASSSGATDKTQRPRAESLEMSRSAGGSAPETRSARSAAVAPSTMSGTALAVGLISGMTGLAFLILRGVLQRQRRHQAIRRAAEEARDQMDRTLLEAVENDSTKQPDEPPTSVRPVTPSAPNASTPASVTARAVAPARSPSGSTTATGRVPPVAVGQTSRVGNPGPPGESTAVSLFNRRASQRVVFESRARLQWEGQDVAGTTTDLSISGTRCRLADGLPRGSAPRSGTLVQITMNLDGTLAILSARVEWQRLEGTAPVVGLQFQRVVEHHRALLRPIIARGTPT